MPDTLSALDATLLELEQASEGAVMSLGAVMVFDRRPRGETPSVYDVCSLVAERLGALPHLRQRLASPRIGRWSRPRWVDDDRFELRNHVRRAALPHPGDDPELCDWIADYYSSRLDRTRPLWEVVLLEGLAEGRWALAYKVHHCLLDDLGSVAAEELLLDPQPDAPRAEAPRSPAQDEALWRSLVPAWTRPIGRLADAAEHTVQAALHAALWPRGTVARSRRLAELVLSDEVIPAPSSSLNLPIGSARRYAAVRCPLAELNEIRGHLGGSVTDAALAALTTGLRCLMLERGETLPEHGLRALIPLNRSAAAHRSDPGFYLIDLPLAEPGAFERHEKIVQRLREQRVSGAWEATGTLIDLSALAPPAVHSWLAGTLYGTRLFNITVACLHAAQRPRYALGARLHELYPFVPLAAEHSIAAGILFHDDQVTFGISADREAMPDLGFFAYGVQQGIDELLGRSDPGAPASSVSGTSNSYD